VQKPLKTLKARFKSVRVLIQTITEMKILFSMVLSAAIWMSAVLATPGQDVSPKRYKFSAPSFVMFKGMKTHYYDLKTERFLPNQDNYTMCFPEDVHLRYCQKLYPKGNITKVYQSIDAVKISNEEDGKPSINIGRPYVCKGNRLTTNSSCVLYKYKNSACLTEQQWKIKARKFCEENTHKTPHQTKWRLGDDYRLKKRCDSVSSTSDQKPSYKVFNYLCCSPFIERRKRRKLRRWLPVPCQCEKFYKRTRNNKGITRLRWFRRAKNTCNKLGQDLFDKIRFRSDKTDTNSNKIEVGFDGVDAPKRYIRAVFACCERNFSSSFDLIPATGKKLRRWSKLCVINKDRWEPGLHISVWKKRALVKCHQTMNDSMDYLLDYRYDEYDATTSPEAPISFKAFQFQCCPKSFLRESPCLQEPDGGTCHAALKKWYFSADEHKCKMFVYGGCEGNENRFLTEKDCEKKCIEPKEVKEKSTKETKSIQKK